jgi:invasion protein IalB
MVATLGESLAVHKIGPRNLFLLVAGLAVFSASATAEAFKLPGGASSLQETYQDWSLSCRSTPKVVCTVSQQQTQQDGRRVLAVELRTSDEAVSGTFVLPFGLHLDVGITLQIDDAAALKPLRFSTCLPTGCLVPLSFDAKTVAALRAGSTLRVKAQSIDARELTFSVSLKGFAAALERLKALVGA